MTLEKAIIGCLLGTAVGDALGLPYEGLNPRRAAQLLGPPDRHRFFFGRGMVSDDTEHHLFVARSLITSRFNPDRFERDLARCLRWWLAGLPAGVGFATLRAILKLWIGFSPRRSGVFSAGNGPAMRSGVLGIAFGDHVDTLRDYVLRSTRITHKDPKAFFGASAIALAANLSSMPEDVPPQEFLQEVRSFFEGQGADEFLELVGRAVASAQANQGVGAFAESIGSRNGILGYMYHTVPCVLQAWLRHQNDFAGGIREIIEAGGDTDTTGAILGAVLGARAGKNGMPELWRRRILEWPGTTAWMERVGQSLAASLDSMEGTGCPGTFWPGIPARNLFFLMVVLFHGFRRLAPPY
jgi:ADP-ribosylglycohydrolase